MITLDAHLDAGGGATVARAGAGGGGRIPDLVLASSYRRVPLLIGSAEHVRLAGELYAARRV